MTVAGEQFTRFRYIHIWSSSEEVRVKCTDPVILEEIIKAINRATITNEILEKIEVERHFDIANVLHGISVTNADEEAYRRLGWWMFRALCDQGWEPIDTGERAYKLKSQQTIERLAF